MLVLMLCYVVRASALLSFACSTRRRLPPAQLLSRRLLHALALRAQVYKGRADAAALRVKVPSLSAQCAANSVWENVSLCTFHPPTARAGQRRMTT